MRNVFYHSFQKKKFMEFRANFFQKKTTFDKFYIKNSIIFYKSLKLFLDYFN